MGRSSDHGVGGMSSAGEQNNNQNQGNVASHRDGGGVRSPKSLASPIKVKKYLEIHYKPISACILYSGHNSWLTRVCEEADDFQHLIFKPPSW